MDVRATARIDIAFWQAFHTSYGLIEFSRRFAHEVGPPPAETPALDNCLRAGIPLASRSSEEMAQLWGQLYAERIDQAGPLVKDFYASFVALAPLQQQELLDRLIAAWPQTIDAAGFQAPSPAAWVAMLMLEIMGRIQRAAEVNPDLSLGSLRESDLGQIIERWDSVVPELAALDLPDVAWIRVGLEQNLAVLAERHRDRELLEKSIGRSTDFNNGADTAPPSPPTRYLLSWLEILDALGMRNTEENQRRVRELNKRFDGPIILPNKGGQPKAPHDRLLTWWNDLERRFRESEEEDRQRQADKRGAVKDRHNYGRDGVVLPNISGHEKKRRAKKGDQ